MHSFFKSYISSGWGNFLCSIKYNHILHFNDHNIRCSEFFTCRRLSLWGEAQTRLVNKERQLELETWKSTLSGVLLRELPSNLHALQPCQSEIHQIPPISNASLLQHDWHANIFLHGYPAASMVVSSPQWYQWTSYFVFCTGLFIMGEDYEGSRGVSTLQLSDNSWRTWRLPFIINVNGM